MPDEVKYVGEWHAGEYHGKGTISYPSGLIYTGSWRKGKKEGLFKIKNCRTNEEYQTKFENDVE